MKRVLFLMGAGVFLALCANCASGEDQPMSGTPEPGKDPKKGLPKPVQSILINRPYKAGQLTLFADRSDDKAFYYVPDKPRLATHETGAPQFSFLRWVDNVRAEPGKPEARVGEGGGIFHAVVSMGVSDEQLQVARSEIQRLKPGAKIVGPVMFTGGTFGLVSSFTDEAGNKGTKVVGLGNAPILDGQNAAVSIRLDKFNSQLLWESFRTPTPDISFKFDMELTGLYAPFKGSIEGNWDNIYKHQSLDAGFAHRYLGAEIHLAFEDLRQKGAIKVDIEGVDDQWETKLMSAYETLASMMFERKLLPAKGASGAQGGAGQPTTQPETAPTPPAGTEGSAPNPWSGKSIMDRAGSVLAAATTKAEGIQAKNEVIRAENKTIRERNATAMAKNAKYLAWQQAVKDAEAVGKKLAAAKERVTTLEAKKPDQAKIDALAKEIDDKKKAREDLKKSADAKPDTKELDAAKAKLAELEKKADPKKPDEALKKEIDRTKAEIAALEKKQADAKPDPELKKKIDAADKEIADLEKQKKDEAGSETDRAAALKTANDEVARLEKEKTAADEKATKLKAEAPEALVELEKEKPELKGGSVPPFALLATYSLKKERRRGNFKIEINKYAPASVSMPFAANIGDLRRYLNTPHFRQVNLDDPLYQQREIVTYIDGEVNAEDFGQYVNFVTFQLRKKHASGDVTDEELKIDRNKFVEKANSFKVLYGWKGDNDRRKWLDYEYRTVWSFFGGKEIAQDWTSTQDGAIPLRPPYQRRTVELHADPELVKSAGVRAATVKIFYDVGDGEQVRQTTLNTFTNVMTGSLKFMLPWDRPDYHYEIIYQLKGNRTVSTGRQQASTGVLILDELPRS